MKRIVQAGLIIVAASVVGVAQAEITAKQVSGKTISSKNATFQIGADGSLAGTTGKGDALSGTWRVQNGAWCRTITKPERLAGDKCQAASIKGKTMTLMNEDGSSVAFKLK